MVAFQRISSCFRQQTIIMVVYVPIYVYNVLNYSFGDVRNFWNNMFVMRCNLATRVSVSCTEDVLPSQSCRVIKSKESYGIVVSLACFVDSLFGSGLFSMGLDLCHL
jgi:hypothetical protein